MHPKDVDGMGRQCRSRSNSSSGSSLFDWLLLPKAKENYVVIDMVKSISDVTRPNEIPNHFEPKCSKDGKFNPKQCTCTTCFCVDPETGEPIEGAIGAGERLGCQLGM